MSYPDSVTVVTYNDKEIYLLGTAHVSAQSVEEVTEMTNLVDPDSICVELCEGRMKSLRDREAFKKMDIFKVLKEKKAMLLFAQLMMSSFYRKLGKELEVTPGAEMIQGVTEAEERKKELVLADRDVQITFRRIWGCLKFWQRMNFLSSILLSMFSKQEEIDKDTIEQLKNKDHLEDAMSEFADSFPGIRGPLIDERDIYLSEKIKHAPGKKVLAVVGAAHVPGIVKQMESDHNLAEIEEIPKELPIIKIIGWLIPLTIIGLIALGFTQGAEKGIATIVIWFLANGIPSALGSMIAGGHPITTIASFFAAPFTSLTPLVGAGMVGGLVQAWAKKPTVGDLEHVQDAMESFKTFRKNSFTRVLLVLIAVTIGSLIGTWTGFGKIVEELFVKDDIQTEIVIPISELEEMKDLSGEAK